MAILSISAIVRFIGNRKVPKTVAALPLAAANELRPASDSALIVIEPGAPDPAKMQPPTLVSGVLLGTSSAVQLTGAGLHARNLSLCV